MRRLFVLLLMGLGAVVWVACEPEQSGPLPCSADHNCSSDQKCYKNVCTPLSAIPKPDAGKEPPPRRTPDAGSKDEPAAGCSASNCKGCCDGDKCVEGNTAAACGTGGGACSKCSGSQTCNAGQCTEPQKSEYPPGPYGANVDDVAIPLATLDRCDGKGSLNLKQYYKHKDITILQITVHTGWCVFCKQQSQGLEAIYQKYKSRGLAIVYVMTEDNRQGSGSISGSYCMKHVVPYKFTFFPVLDSGSKEIRKYFDRGAYPFNMLITTKDMKIRYKKTGASIERINGIIETYLRD